MKVLAIGAHPDDIEIFMLGFLLSCKARKDSIHVAIATDGAAGKVLNFPDLKNIRKEETIKGLNCIAKPHFFGFPDGELVLCLEATRIIKDYIYSVQPDLIITHAPEDYHPDHRALSNFVQNSTGFLCPILYADTLMGVSFNPDYYIDITEHIKVKKNAILQHKSQNPDSFLEATLLLNRFRSAQCNAPKNNYAEAFRFEKRLLKVELLMLLKSFI